MHPTDAYARETATAGPGRRRDTLLWVVVLGGPFVWLLQLSFSFLLAPPACDSGARWPLHLLAAVSLAVAIACLAGAAALLRGFSRDEPTWATNRARFMARLGIATSALFTIVVLATWIPTFVSECGAP